MALSHLLPHSKVPPSLRLHTTIQHTDFINMSSPSSVSYETYAPRSTAQRDRLARIAELTAGPAAYYSSKATTTSSPSSYRTTSNTVSSSNTSVSGNQHQQPPSSPFLIRAMCPEAYQENSNKNGNGGTESITMMDDPEEDIYSSFLFRRDDNDYKNTKAITTDDISTKKDGTNDTENVKSSFTTPRSATLMPQGTIMDHDTIQQVKTTSSHTCTALRQCITSSTQLQNAIQSCIQIATSVQSSHAELLLHSGEISDACEQLQQEEAILSKQAQFIGTPLLQHDAIDAMSIKVGVLFKEGGQVVVRGLARVNVDSEEYVQVLNVIDEAIVFFFGGGVGGSADAALGLEGQEYGRRALVLHEAAIFLVRLCCDCCGVGLCRWCWCTLHEYSSCSCCIFGVDTSPFNSIINLRNNTCLF